MDRSQDLLLCSLQKLMEEVALVQDDVEEMNGHEVVDRFLFQHLPEEEDHEDIVEAIHKEETDEEQVLERDDLEVEVEILEDDQLVHEKQRR